MPEQHAQLPDKIGGASDLTFFFLLWFPFPFPFTEKARFPPGGLQIHHSPKYGSPPLSSRIQHTVQSSQAWIMRKGKTRSIMYWGTLTYCSFEMIPLHPCFIQERRPFNDRCSGMLIYTTSPLGDELPGMTVIAYSKLRVKHGPETGFALPQLNFYTRNFPFSTPRQPSGFLPF